MSLIFRAGSFVVVCACAASVFATVTVTPIEDKPADAPASQPAVSSATSQPGDPPLSIEGVTTLVDQAKYRDALRLIGRLIGMQGYDKTQLMILRGECQLQIHENASALSTLREASRQAAATNNPVGSGDAAAFATLIEKSPHYTYSPLNSPEKKPLDILDRTNRKAAYVALYTDMVVVLQAQLRDANAKGSLPPFMEIARDIPALRGVEHINTGNTKQTDAFSNDVAKAAAKIINSTLSDFDAKVNQISIAAEHLIVTGSTGTSYGTTQQMRHTGLTGDNGQTLEDIESTCAKIPAAVQQLTLAFKAPEPFFHLATHAETTATRAKTVRTKDYSRP